MATYCFLSFPVLPITDSSFHYMSPDFAVFSHKHLIKPTKQAESSLCYWDVYVREDFTLFTLLQIFRIRQSTLFLSASGSLGFQKKQVLCEFYFRSTDCSLRHFQDDPPLNVYRNAGLYTI